MRNLLASAIACLLVFGSIFAGISGGPGVSSSPGSALRFDVCPSGCKYTQLCGVVTANCSQADDISCAAGTALAAVKAADPNVWKVVDVGPGVYPECVGLNEMHKVVLRGPGGVSALIHPIPNLGTILGDPNAAISTKNPWGPIRIGDVQNFHCSAAGTPWDCCTGNLVGICNGERNSICVGAGDPNTCCTGAGTGTCAPVPRNTTDIVVTGIACRADAHDSGNPCVSFGEPVTDHIMNWDNVWLYDNYIMSSLSGITINGSDEDSGTSGWPWAYVTNNIIAVGSAPITPMGNFSSVIKNNTMIVDPLFCSDPNQYAAVGPTAVPAGASDEDALCTGVGLPYTCCSGAGAGTCETIGIVLDPNDASAVHNFFGTRRVTFADTGGCAASDTNPRRVGSYDPNNNILFFDDGQAAWSTAPDPNCTYTITAYPAMGDRRGLPTCDTPPFWDRVPPTPDWVGKHGIAWNIGWDDSCVEGRTNKACPTGANNDGSELLIEHNTCYMNISTQAQDRISGMTFESACFDKIQVIGNSFDIEILEGDTGEFATTDLGVAQCIYTGTAPPDSLEVTGNRCRLINSGNTELNVHALTNDDQSVDYSVTGGHYDIQATVGGYNGTVTHLETGSTANIDFGNLTWAQEPVSDPNDLPGADLIPGGVSTGTVTVDPNTAVTDQCRSMASTATVLGAQTGDVCIVTAQTATDGVSYDCTVTAANTVTLRYCGFSGGADNPGSTVFDILVIGR